MTSARWNFPNGSNGDALTAALAGATAVVTTDGTAVISTAQAIIGTRSCRQVSSATGANYIERSGLSSTAIAIDCYLYIATSPGGFYNIVWAGASSSIRCAQIALGTTRVLRLIDNTGATLWTSTAIPLNTWVRVSLFATMSPTSGTARAAWYNQHDTTPQSDSGLLTGLNTQTTTDRVRVGLKATSSGTVGGDIYIGSWAYDDAATDLLPPYSESLPVGTATLTHDWLISAAGVAFVVPLGAAALDHQWAVSASGVAPVVGLPTGAAVLSHQWDVAAAGVAPAIPIPTGSATLTHQWGVSAQGTTPPVGIPFGQATLDHLWEVAATGEAPPVDLPSGSVSLDHLWEVSAEGETIAPVLPAEGAASLDHHWSVFAQGVAEGVVPPVVKPDPPIFVLMQNIISCLCGELALSYGGPTCFCGMIPGLMVPMDYCDCNGDSGACGMAWIRLDQVMTSSENFGRTQLLDFQCAPLVAYRLNMGVTRCVPGLDEDGNPPDEFTQSESTRIIIGDLTAMQRTIECCMPVDRRNWTIERYTPIGPQGNCAGGAVNFVIRVL